MPDRFEQIKQHFESEAKRFDAHFFKVAPFYHDAIDALVSALPFKPNKKLKVIDLGCGTGNIAKAVIKRYPKSEIVCIDLAQNMLDLARAKLKKFKNVEYHLGDIRSFNYGRGYDAVISSLVLHHVDGTEKTRFYKKMFNILNKGGIFYTTDITLGSSNFLQEMYIEKWKAFMYKNLTKAQINETLKKHAREDVPCKLMDELEFLRCAGFRNIDVIWKTYYFCVYGGEK